MTRPFLSRAAIAAALAGLGMLALTGLMTTETERASAQGAPPPTPTVFYGTASGAAIGSNAVALVSAGGSSTVCGSGKVLNEGGPVYAVPVVTHEQKQGCGAPGRQVRIYVTGTQPGEGRLSNSRAWPGSPASPVYSQEFNLSLGAPLDTVFFVPLAARTVAQ